MDDIFGMLIIRLHMNKPTDESGKVLRGSSVTLARYHLCRGEAAAQYKAWLTANPHLPRNGSVQARFVSDEWISGDE